jgi:predicted AAA+ superfamily ATPase
MLKIIDFLIDNKPFDYSKKQIMEESGISKATLFKYFDKLEESGVVKISRTFGKTKLYRINMESLVVKRIVDLEMSIIGHSSPVMRINHPVSSTIHAPESEILSCK